MDKSIAISTLLHAAEIAADADSLSVAVPGGIPPVEQDAGMAQRVHTLVVKSDGRGYLRSPNGKDRPLTESDKSMFKQYFLNLGKVIKTMKEFSGT